MDFGEKVDVTNGYFTLGFGGGDGFREELFVAQFCEESDGGIVGFFNCFSPIRDLLEGGAIGELSFSFPDVFGCGPNNDAGSFIGFFDDDILIIP